MSILIHEVGPRDGLQIEKQIIPTLAKLAWIETILESGVDILQLGSFVSAERVPQMADTESLFQRVKSRATRLSALVLNEKGLERAFASGVDFICMGASASETHSRKNTGMGTAEAVTRISAMAKRALNAGATVQVSVQSAFGCGFDGEIPQDRVLHIIERFLETGARHVSLADTAGVAHPAQVEDLFGAARMLDPEATLACHFHDTYGMALANCYAALRAGVTVFESAVGGLGGCPFTAGTAGNVATEDLVHMLQKMNFKRDVRIEALIVAAKSMELLLGRALPGRVHSVAARDLVRA